MKHIARIFGLWAALAGVLHFSSCATPTAPVAKDPTAAPAMCRFAAKKVNGQIRIYLPPFDPKLKEFAGEWVTTLEKYVKGTTDLQEGETKVFEIDLNTLVKTAHPPSS